MPDTRTYISHGPFRRAIRDDQRMGKVLSSMAAWRWLLAGAASGCVGGSEGARRASYGDRTRASRSRA